MTDIGLAFKGFLLRRHVGAATQGRGISPNAELRQIDAITEGKNPDALDTTLAEIVMGMDFHGNNPLSPALRSGPTAGSGAARHKQIPSSNRIFQQKHTNPSGGEHQDKTYSIQLILIPPPPKRRACDMRPLWRDLILKVWGGDPLQCPCCKGTMKPVRTHLRPGEIEFFLRLHGLWEGIIHLPRPPPPPFDIETMEPIEPPWQAIKEWIPDDEPDLNWFNQERAPEGDNSRKYDQSSAWQPEEVPLGDGQTLVLDPT